MEKQKVEPQRIEQEKPKQRQGQGQKLEQKKLTRLEIQNLSLSASTIDHKHSKDFADLNFKVIESLKTIEAKAFRAIKESDVINLSLKHSEGRFSLEQLQDFSKKFARENLHEIGQDKDRWTKDDAKRDLQLHLRLGEKERGTFSKVIQHRVKMSLSNKYQKRVQRIYLSREQLHEKQEQKSKADGKIVKRLYTLKAEAYRESLYSIVREKLSLPLKKILPEGRKPLSYRYQQQQRRQAYLKTRKRYERRRAQFKRKIFFLYMRGKISHRTYQNLRDGKGTPKSIRLANFKYATHQISKKQRDYVAKVLEKKEQAQQRKQAEMKLELQQKKELERQQNKEQKSSKAVITVTRESDKEQKKQSTQTAPKITIERERDRER